jgi:hypothetical protein
VIDANTEATQGSSQEVKPRIVFLVMSAVNKPEVVDQLALALAPHVVLVHHDFSQTPDFRLAAQNVVWVPDPKRTGWAFFGFVDGIFHSLRHALARLDFDYLQLLSPTCLPIKPVREYEGHVSGRVDAHFDCVDLFQDPDVLMSVGYRALTPEKSFRHRIARRLSAAYFGASAGRRDEAGIWLRTGGGEGVVPGLALLVTRMLSRPAIGRHIFDETFRPYYGTTWFGARRHVIAAMVDHFSRSGVRDYFSRLCIADEFLIPTLLMHVVKSKGPMNHFIQTYDLAHPGSFDTEDFEQLRQIPAYFARKFPDNAAAPIRAKVLAELVGGSALPVQAEAKVRTASTPSAGGLVPAHVTRSKDTIAAGARWRSPAA